MLTSNILNKYRTALLSLPTDRALTKEDLLIDDFLIARSGEVEMYYSPHNEYANPAAKVILIGITPGWTQMQIAFQAATKAIQQGLMDEEVCRIAKEKARFAGSMRRNLIDMLNRLELHRYLNISSCEQLFEEHQLLLHSTSLLPFPVFVRKKNYTGASPKLLSTPLLREPALLFLKKELHFLQQAFIIPLGSTVEDTLHLLEREGKLDPDRCLWGFPHPSGANGHRYKQFSANFTNMKRTIEAFFSNK
jgi:hypothetical protein